MVEDQQVDQDGLVETVGRCVGVFYADDGMVGLRDPNWLQHPMNFLFGLFRRFILAANATKSLTMTCQPGTLRTGISEEAMKLWSVEWNSPQGPWRHTAASCMGLIPQSTGVNCGSDRQYTNPRCIVWALRGRRSSALSTSRMPGILPHMDRPAI